VLSERVVCKWRRLAIAELAWIPVATDLVVLLLQRRRRGRGLGVYGLLLLHLLHRVRHRLAAAAPSAGRHEILVGREAVWTVPACTLHLSDLADVE